MQGLVPDLPAGHTEQQDRDDGEQAGDDPVGGLIGHRLDGLGEGNALRPLGHGSCNLSRRRVAHADTAAPAARAAGASRTFRVRRSGEIRIAFRATPTFSGAAITTAEGSKRQLPAKWRMEFTDQVMSCTKKARTSPPHSKPVATPSRLHRSGAGRTGDAGVAAAGL